MTATYAPLPGGWADELLWHVRNCTACRMLRRSPNVTLRMCERGQELVRLTLEERHGKADDHDE